jgi:hypothetical protein
VPSANGGAPAAEPAAGPTTYTRAPSAPESEPIDLLASARGSIVKRLVPIAAVALAVVLWRLLRRR